MQWYDGSVLTDKRKFMGLTQAQVSEQTGLSRNQIIAMEKGNFTGGIRYIRKYLELLGLKIAFEAKQHDVPQFDELTDLFTEAD